MFRVHTKLAFTNPQKIFCDPFSFTRTSKAERNIGEEVLPVCQSLTPVQDFLAISPHAGHPAPLFPHRHSGTWSDGMTSIQKQPMFFSWFTYYFQACSTLIPRILCKFASKTESRAFGHKYEMSAKEFEDTGLPSTSGDAQTFKSLFLHWQPKLQAFIHGFVKDEETAKDLCSNIFLKLWLRREEIPVVSNMGAFLFRMAKNAIYNHFEHCSVAEHIYGVRIVCETPKKFTGSYHVKFRQGESLTEVLRILKATSRPFSYRQEGNVVVIQAQ